MANPSGAEKGPIASLGALAAALLALVRTRVELAVVELQEESERRKHMLVLAAAAGIFLTLAALLLALSIVVIFWDEHRAAAALGVTAIYLAIGIYAAARLKAAMRDSPPPFEATRAELAKEVGALRSADG